MENHYHNRAPAYRAAPLIAGILVLTSACGHAPSERESTSITCDGVTLSAAADSVDIAPLITLKSDDETPTAIRLGTDVKDPSVPFSKGSINVPLGNNEVRSITVVVLTNKIGSVAICPSVDAYLHPRHQPPLIIRNKNS